MQNLQSLLREMGRKLRGFYIACLTKHSKKVLAYGMAIVVFLSALPITDGMFSVNVKAATADEEQEAVQTLPEIEAAKEHEETMEVTQADSNDIMIPSLKLAAKVEKEVQAADKKRVAEEIYLEIFGEEDDELLESDIVVEETVVEIVKTAEELFYESLDYSSIPQELTVNYNPDFCMELSAEQLTVLETIVEAESGGEDIYGRMLVANVVLNRVLSDEFPDTVKEVVFQNNGKTYQFSPVRSGGRYYTVTVSDTTKRAVARVLSGEDYSDGALYFFARRLTTKKKAKWFDTALNKIVEYGCHEFFGDK